MTNTMKTYNLRIQFIKINTIYFNISFMQMIVFYFKKFFGKKVIRVFFEFLHEEEFLNQMSPYYDIWSHYDLYITSQYHILKIIVQKSNWVKDRDSKSFACSCVVTFWHWNILPKFPFAMSVQ